MESDDVSMPIPDGSDGGGGGGAGDAVWRELDAGCPRPRPAGCLQECRLGSGFVEEIRGRTGGEVDGMSNIALLSLH